MSPRKITFFVISNSKVTFFKFSNSFPDPAIIYKIFGYSAFSFAITDNINACPFLFSNLAKVVITGLPFIFEIICSFK